MSDPIYVTVDSSPPVTVSVTANPSPLSVAVTTTGDRGPKGDTGPANTLSIGTVTTGSTASATITGSAPNQTLNLTLPGADLTGLATVATTGSAADLTGTLSTDRLPASVPLLVGGLIPSSLLPSYCDDVIDGTLATFPATGEAGKIYVNTASTPPSIYRWSGTNYVQIVGSPGSTDAVTEGTTNLYFTAARAAAAAPVQSVAGRTGAVAISASDVSGLGSLATMTTSGKAASDAFLRGDGAWATPPGTTYTAGAGIKIDGNTISCTVSSGGTYTAGSGIAIVDGAISAAVTQVAGRTGAISLTSSDIGGLGPLATLTPTGTASSSTWLRGDGSWQPIVEGIGGTAEYASTAAFPQPGVAGRIYIDASRSRLYRWTSDLVYAECGSVQGSSAAKPSPAPIVAALIAG